jgi:hypothetical protein
MRIKAELHFSALNQLSIPWGIPHTYECLQALTPADAEVAKLLSTPQAESPDF